MELNERVTETVIRLPADVLPGGMDLTPQSSLREHGLDSISAVRVWFELQREFSLDLPVEKLGVRQSGAARRVCHRGAGRCATR
ncbi:acyl carrier protein [Streptosporangium sp. 'caverna']|uniref:acyl carrier protein n=1 Tax=Streptosporangium sp. 'caverna' TaxID=2202249 RepID=UPI003517CADE